MEYAQHVYQFYIRSLSITNQETSVIIGLIVAIKWLQYFYGDCSATISTDSGIL
jgi:hypothetical protein